MYALVLEHGAANTLEFFHPLYVPALWCVRALVRAAGATGPAILFYQLLSLAGAAVHLRLVHALARRALDARAALIAAALAAATINLWAWSLQTMPYTWATSAMLAVFCALPEDDGWSARRCAALGALCALAAGLDTAAAVAAPLALYELFRAERSADRRAPLSAAFLAAFLGGLALCYGVFFAFHGRVPNPAAELPADIVTLLHSRSLAVQWRDFVHSGAPEDAPWAVLAAFAAWTARRLRADAAPALGRLRRLALGVFVLIALFFFLNNPHNRFLYAAGLLFPVLAAAELARLSRPAAPAAALAAALVALNVARPARYLPPRNEAVDEARFVARSLGAGDLLLVVSEPSWLFTYFLPPGPAILSAASPGPELDARVASVLAAGGRVWLAPDSLFMDETVPLSESQARVARAVERLDRRFVLGQPAVSPGDQYYYPVFPRAASASRL